MPFQKAGMSQQLKLKFLMAIEWAQTYQLVVSLKCKHVIYNSYEGRWKF